MNRIGLILLALVIGMTQAEGSDGYHARYEKIKNSMGDTVVVDKIIKSQLSFQNYLNGFTEALRFKANPLSFLEETCALREYDDPTWIKKFSENLLDEDDFDTFNKIISSKEFFMRANEVYVKADPLATIPLQPNVMLNLSDPAHFYKRQQKLKAADEVLSLLLDQLVDEISSNSLQRLVRYVVTDYLSQIELAQSHSRNRLFYYLTHYPAKDLEMTEQERGRALSSYYDSQIRIGNFSWSGLQKTYKAAQKSQEIVENFETYGRDRVRGLYAQMNERIESPEVKEAFPRGFGDSTGFFKEAYAGQGKSFYVSFLDTRDLREKKPAATWDPNCWSYTKEKRQYFKSFNLALEIIPVPYLDEVLKYLFPQWVLRSNYIGQSLNEAILISQFYEEGNSSAAKAVLEQSLIFLLNGVEN